MGNVKGLIALLICGVFIMNTGLFAATGIETQNEPRLVDKNTKFHRLFVVGRGDNWIERSGF